jgi:hypothetical protein
MKRGAECQDATQEQVSSFVKMRSSAYSQNLLKFVNDEDPCASELASLLHPGSKFANTVELNLMTS